ncbi:helix-turn-helix domain-containing protein [Photorhabdus akhurstii]|uniref:helix-turn-helix domain-containing protein n=1 Tax=Photorhabdus akhurstii TaxID=171438 RepID=UPI00052C5289|nr:helix-turn-helix transcriptional regulator [Photorhabdus akhurstii]KGM26587.1 transcriptional regulator [Photorhabdus luminescens]MBS9429209.1 XRE family transcriptional regulator [Photorhabdus akhurstii]
MITLDELLEKRSPESRCRIAKKVDEMKREIGLYQIREALDVSQTELATALGVKQPTIAKIEQPGNNPKLSTLKRYVAALGGELSLDVQLPDGKRIVVHI